MSKLSIKLLAGDTSVTNDVAGDAAVPSASSASYGRCCAASYHVSAYVAAHLDDTRYAYSLPPRGLYRPDHLP